jgi:SAM-dependent methyltransferase
MISLAHLGSIVRELPARIVARLRWKFGRGIGYWEERARRYGARAVMHRAHPEQRIGEITQGMKSKLLPLLYTRMNGNEKLILDFGCGVGRFTASLAELGNCRAIGVDPIASLLALAPLANNVEYRRMQGGRIPLDDAAADVVFIVLVLGAITNERDLHATLAEIDRVLAPNGLLFIVENTTPKRANQSTRFRSYKQYARLFSFAELQFMDSYDDLGETHSIMSGRRRAAPPT